MLLGFFSCKKTLHTEDPVKPANQQPTISKSLSKQDFATARQLLLTDIEKFHSFIRTARDISQQGNVSRTIPLDDPDPADNDTDNNYDAGESFSNEATYTGWSFDGMIEFTAFVSLYGDFNRRGNTVFLDYKYGFGMSANGFVFENKDGVNMHVVGNAVGEISPPSGYLNIFERPDQWRVNAHAESICYETRTRVVSTTGAVKFNAGFNAMGAQVGAEWSAGFTVQSISYITGRYDMKADVVFNRTINSTTFPQPTYSYTLTGVNYGDQRN